MSEKRPSTATTPATRAPRASLVQPRRLEPLKMIVVASFIVALFFWGARRYRRPNELRAATLNLRGVAMGTTWSVRIADGKVREADLPALRTAVEGALADVERQMSVYDPSSEISRLNKGPADVPIDISDGFAKVLRFALELAERSGGAFDPTVGPLVELWGFGPRSGPRRVPSEEEISAAREAVGFDRIAWQGSRRILKRHAGVRLDLNAVAKGYGVDQAVAALEGKGLRNFFVEVGGEIAVRGRRPGGGPWRIGVDRPSPDAVPGAELQRVLHMDGAAVATSGDYRNYFRDENTGETWAHIFDPRDGRPIRGMAGSVTVIADTCMIADGLATALYVMGPDEGLPWLAQSYPEAEALFILRGPAGALVERASEGFDKRAGLRGP